MEKELGAGNTYPDLLQKLAQYECALVDFYNDNLGASKYGVFANKCWPSFEKYFGFVPCYVNSRLAERGIPVACEVDIYGALTEYMITCATGEVVKSVSECRECNVDLDCNSNGEDSLCKVEEGVCTLRSCFSVADCKVEGSMCEFNRCVLEISLYEEGAI